MSESDCESFSDESNCDSPTGRTIFSAPSDECTVNEVREAETRKVDKYKTTITHSGNSNGKTQVSVKINTVPSEPRPLKVKINAMTTMPQSHNALGGIGSPDIELSPVPSVIKRAVNPRWTQFTNLIHSLILGGVVNISVHAARYPKTYAITVTMISLVLITVGFFTNFNVNTDEQLIYAPFKSRVANHGDWIRNDSGFPGNTRYFTMVLHSDGDNAMSASNVRKNFHILDEVTNVPGYQEMCAQGDYVNFDGERTCKVMSVTRFFQDDVDTFDEVYEEGGEEAIAQTISAKAYENQAPVDTEAILGNVAYDETTGNIAYFQSFRIIFFIPYVDGVKEMEGLILEKVLRLRDDWETEGSTLKIEVFSQRSYSDEFGRAIGADLPLLPIVFLLMSGFTCMVFFRCDRVQSRSLLGIGSVITIVLAMMSTFGLMFAIGVPFTNMTLILPFVIFGVGLDDTFIITGAYFRTDPNKDPVDRIREAMEEIGLSITVTTITTMFAFILGCTSTIPAIYWLNLYAFPCIVIDYFFQITFFVALIVLDERRIQANRMDCCCICLKGNDQKIGDWDNKLMMPAIIGEQQKTIPERLMGWYAKQLLRPWVKVTVVITFLAYAAFCAYTTSRLTQEFDFADLLPADSYIKGFLYSMEKYSSRMTMVGIYFRGDFDQLDPENQQQMKNYVDELSALPQLVGDVPFCWFMDLEDVKNSSFAESVGLENMTAHEQLDFILSIPAIEETYGKHIVRDESGNITASRCYTYVADIDFKVVKEQIQFLQAQRQITARQPMNQGKDEWSFFTWDQIYFIWEFYSVAVQELINTTIAGVAAVCAVGFFFFPHWNAMFYTIPLIIMLYIDLLGTLEWAGLHVNAVTYVCLVISIGLMVDFIVHVLLRYYESEEETRHGKVKDTLETMGASILVGGISTAIGVLPLAFSTSEIMGSVFISFFAMIILGVLHGLVFLPVVLAICGPVATIVTDGQFEDTGDLALKAQQGESDTDESDLSDDGCRTQKSSEGVERELTQSWRQPGTNEVTSHAKSFETSSSNRCAKNRSDQVLLSSTTCYEESLEVVKWRPTMAWI